MIIRLAAAFSVLATLSLAMTSASTASAKPVILAPSERSGDTLAVFYSGDGGWGPLDAKVARRLAADGVPTVGINSLAYFSARRSPQTVADDLAAELRDYERQWGRSKVTLIGYSFGADALPAIIPRLPGDLRAQIGHVVLIGTGPHGDLRFHPASWLNLAPPDSFPVQPAIAALKNVDVQDVKITCVYGDKERADICPTLPDAEVAKVRLPGGHHFNGDYAALGDAVLRASR
ncbi:AcvB/VirJ family lysyl-phosphatidylglycerol hydrolase [Caulobacter sp.]|uniref:AcvB/VirJ family lysyl-phosphatidylglycerol hydrolase n=1 Tax=Caulobacter sp. TaxID=78 RepID=UPI001B12BF00|nr:AcvB/VirJ family lysyl-phosphatidylglycerol hydrolase [Caulobacter sp.]MBO9544015.1 virulence factor [Caulobacter sp.]